MADDNKRDIPLYIWLITQLYSFLAFGHDRIGQIRENKFIRATNASDSVHAAEVITLCGAPLRYQALRQAVKEGLDKDMSL